MEKDYDESEKLFLNRMADKIEYSTDSEDNTVWFDDMFPLATTDQERLVNILRNLADYDGRW